MGNEMTTEERAIYQQRYRERWRRWQAELSWSKGPMTTWKPVMTERQQKEFDEYRIKNRLPF
jgi:hypothetical protein